MILKGILIPIKCFLDSIISLIQIGESFIKRNCKMKWHNTANPREEILFLLMYLTGLDI